MEFQRYIKKFWFYSNFLKNKSTQFGIKLGLLAGTTYYLSEKGIWGDSDTTLELYNKMKTNVSPYTQEISKQIPFEFPSLPSTGEVSYVTKYYWNKGVMASFAFLANIPSYISEYSSKRFEEFLDNSEVKNLLASGTDTEN